MGMFDVVKCEVPLPDGYTGELQTKSFDSTLATISIRADGRLLIEEVEYERMPPSAWPPSKPRRPGLLGELRRKSSQWRDMNFHGEFTFYGSDNETGKWHSYVARFTHGQFEYIIPERPAR